jgi:hypothetical protein
VVREEGERELEPRVEEEVYVVDYPKPHQL